MGDRIAILDVGGVLEQYATPAEILGRPASTMVARLRRRRPRAQAAPGHAHRGRVPRAPAHRLARRVGRRRPHRHREVDAGWVAVVGADGVLRGYVDDEHARRRRRSRRAPPAHRDLGADRPRPAGRARHHAAHARGLGLGAGRRPLRRRAHARGRVPDPPPVAGTAAGRRPVRRRPVDGDAAEAWPEAGTRSGIDRWMTMDVADSLLDLVGNTPLVRLGRVGPRPRVRPPRQGRAVQPGRQREGPSRGRDDRRRRARRATAARRHHRRADVGQHRRRPRHRGRPARLPVHLRDVRQDERGEGLAAARVRRRRRGLPDRGAARAPRLVLLGRRPPHARDARRVPARPVLQPRQPGRARALDRSRDLAADRRAGHPLRGRRRHRRHHHRRRPLPQGAEPRRADRRRRPRRARCTRAVPAGPTSSRAWARTSGPPRSTRRPSTAR